MGGVAASVKFLVKEIQSDQKMTQVAAAKVCYQGRSATLIRSLHGTHL